MITDLRVNDDERLTINVGKYINEKMFSVNLSKEEYLETLKTFSGVCTKENMTILDEKHYTDFKHTLKVDSRGNAKCFYYETSKVNIFQGTNYDLRTSIYKETEVPFYNIHLPKTIGNEVKVFTIIMKHKYYEVHFKTKINSSKESFYEINFILTHKYTKFGIGDIIKRMGENKLKLGNVYENEDVLITV